MKYYFNKILKKLQTFLELKYFFNNRVYKFYNPWLKYKILYDA